MRALILLGICVLGTVTTSHAGTFTCESVGPNPKFYENYCAHFVCSNGVVKKVQQHCLEPTHGCILVGDSLHLPGSCSHFICRSGDNGLYFEPVRKCKYGEECLDAGEVVKGNTCLAMTCVVDDNSAGMQYNGPMNCTTRSSTCVPVGSANPEADACNQQTCHFDSDNRRLYFAREHPTPRCMYGDQCLEIGETVTSPEGDKTVTCTMEGENSTHTESNPNSGSNPNDESASGSGSSDPQCSGCIFHGECVAVNEEGHLNDCTMVKCVEINGVKEVQIVGEPMCDFEDGGSVSCVPHAGTAMHSMTPCIKYTCIITITETNKGLKAHFEYDLDIRCPYNGDCLEIGTVVMDNYCFEKKCYYSPEHEMYGMARTNDHNFCGVMNDDGSVMCLKEGDTIVHGYGDCLLLVCDADKKQEGVYKLRIDVKSSGCWDWRIQRCLEWREEVEHSECNSYKCKISPKKAQIVWTGPKQCYYPVKRECKNKGEKFFFADSACNEVKCKYNKIDGPRIIPKAKVWRCNLPRDAPLSGLPIPEKCLEVGTSMLIGDCDVARCVIEYNVLTVKWEVKDDPYCNMVER